MSQAKPGRCHKCKEFHGPNWGRKQCWQQQQIYKRLEIQARRRTPPFAR